MTAPSSEPGGLGTTAEAQGGAPRSPDDALAAAEALAAQGRSLEAIDLLVEANRANRDARLEARLVTLRNAAFAELDRSPTPSPWPDDEPRPRDAEVALPPIDPGELSADAVRDHILRYGCAYVPGLIPKPVVDRLTAGIDRAFDGWDANATPGRRAGGNGELDPWYVRFEPPDGEKINPINRKFVRDGAAVWIVESPRMMFEFFDVLERRGVRQVITEYLGERPALTLRKSTVRRVEPLPRADWHQDGAFLGEGIRTINLWLSLSRCGDDAPGLDLVPRRLDHVVETGTGGAVFDWSAGEDAVEREAGDVPVISPIFEPGDALLFDELFMHRTATHEGMTRARYATETWFFAPSRYPGDQIPFVW